MQNEDDKLRIVFTGDCSFTGIFGEKVLQKGEIFSTDIRDIFDGADFTVCNLEGPVTDKISENSSGVVSPPGSINVAIDAGINVFSLANNHIFDCGIDGFMDTVKEIENRRQMYIGAGLNLEAASGILYFRKKEIKVALVSFGMNEGMLATKLFPGIFAEKHIKLLHSRIHEATASNHRVIVMYHGGEEFTHYPSPPKRRLLRKIVRINGVVAVIAHHSHSIQGVEEIDKVAVYYSLGNLVFDIPQHKGSDESRHGSLVEIIISEDGFSTASHFVKIDRESGVVVLNNDFKGFSELCNFEDYKRKWRAAAYQKVYGNLTPNLSSPEQKQLREKSLFGMLFTRIFWKRISEMTADKYMRSLFIAAVIHKYLGPKDAGK